MHVKDVQKDLCDGAYLPNCGSIFCAFIPYMSRPMSYTGLYSFLGLALINLLEIVTDKKFGRYNKHPVVPFQKVEIFLASILFIVVEACCVRQFIILTLGGIQVENCVLAIEFMEKEGIKLVNIGM